MRADNTGYLAAAARRRAEQTRQRAVAALRHMDATGVPISVEAVARHAGVSRSWLYAQPDLRAEIERQRARRPHNPASAPPDRQRASDASLLRRLEAATERIRRLEEDNRQLRDALARALGERRTADILGRPRDTPEQHTRESHRTVPHETAMPPSNTPSTTHRPSSQP